MPQAFGKVSNNSAGWNSRSGSGIGSGAAFEQATAGTVRAALESVGFVELDNGPRPDDFTLEVKLAPKG